MFILCSKLHGLKITSLSAWNWIARAVYILCMADALLFLAYRNMAYMVTNEHTCRWMVLPSPHTKTPSRKGHFSLISKRILSNTWGSIKLDGSLLNRTLLPFLKTRESSEFMFFKVKLWSLWESFRMLFNYVVFLSSWE